MRERTFSVVVVGCSIALASVQEAAASDADAWHISPIVGVSYATGLVGAEVRRGHFAVAGGTLPACYDSYGCAGIVTTALKYYVRDEGHSWAVAAFSWSWSDAGGRDRLWGLAIERHWRFSSGWALAAGLGVGETGEDIAPVNPMPSFTVGYSF